MFFMTHPLHGAMHAYSVTEKELLEKSGWGVSTAEKWLGDKFKPEYVKPKLGRPAKQ